MEWWQIILVIFAIWVMLMGSVLVVFAIVSYRKEQKAKARTLINQGNENR